MGDDACNCDSRFPNFFRDTGRCLVVHDEVTWRLIVVRLRRGEGLVYVLAYRDARCAGNEDCNITPSFGDRFRGVLQVRVGQVQDGKDAHDVFGVLVGEGGEGVANVNRAAVSRGYLRAAWDLCVAIEVCPGAVGHFKEEGVGRQFVCDLTDVIGMVYNLIARWVYCFARGIIFFGVGGADD